RRSRNGIAPVPCVVATLRFPYTQEHLATMAGAIATDEHYFATLARLLEETSGFSRFNGMSDSHWPSVVLVVWDSRATIGRIQRTGLVLAVENKTEIDGVDLAGHFLSSSGAPQKTRQFATAQVSIQLHSEPVVADLALVAKCEVLDQVNETLGVAASG